VEDSYGNRLSDDVYACLVTVEDMEGQFSHRRTFLRVADGMARFESLEASNTSAAASSEGQDIVTILRDDDDLPMIQLLHDGESGRIVSGKGGLSFRTGNGLAGEDVEYMHLTADGNLGIGVSEPQATLDVSGLIRTSEGIMFPDGSIQRSAAEGGFIGLRGTGYGPGGVGTLAVTGRQRVGGRSAGDTTAGTNKHKEMLVSNGTISPVFYNETGTNTWFGENAGATPGTGTYNSFFGYGAGMTNTVGSSNVFVGASAGMLSTSSVNNVFVGVEAGKNNGTVGLNTFVGYQAGLSNTAGPWNTFIGSHAGYYNTSGYGNAFLGCAAGFRNTIGNHNAFFGNDAGKYNTTGQYNSFFGRASGYNNLTGSSNAFVGTEAGYNSSTGSQNSYLGTSAGYSNSGGSYNLFAGHAAGYYTNADFNCFVGASAGSMNTVGYSNSFVGMAAGSLNTTGYYNSFLGAGTGFSNTVENQNTFIGAHSDGTAGISNATVLGYAAKVTQSNSLVLGSINYVNGATADTNVGIGTTAPTGKLHVKGGENELLYVGVTGDIGIGTVTPDKRVQVISTAAKNATLHLGGTGDSAKDIFAGMGEDVDAGPAFNYGYAGYSFGRSAGFFNVRPDASAVPPNPSLRFMTANQQRMIITNTGDVGIGTTDPKVTLHVQGSGVYVGSPGEGIILKSPDGLTCARLTIDNSGTPGFSVIACP